MTYTSLTLTHTGPVATLTLARPDIHNAFDETMVAELRACVAELAGDPAVRVVVLAGAGASFCAGADLRWMRASLDWDRAQNLADAEALAAMFDVLWGLPKPLLGRIHGPALGGGVGLVACCDIAVAAETAAFGLSEVKLGLIPAVIAQYVVPKIGVSQARALFVSGERFSAARAFEIGLVHAVTGADELDAAVGRLAQRLLSSAPAAAGAAKRLVDAVWELDRASARRYVVEAIAEARSGAEGQAGIQAFLEKRKPPWSI